MANREKTTRQHAAYVAEINRRGRQTANPVADARAAVTQQVRVPGQVGSVASPHALAKLVKDPSIATRKDIQRFRHAGLTYDELLAIMKQPSLANPLGT